MFCVLSVKERNRTLFERLFRKFLVDEYSVKTVPVFKGAPFFMLDITTGKREIDWDNVVFAVGKCAGRLVLSDEIVLPENVGICAFKSGVLYDKMMKNTFIHIIHNNQKRYYSLSVMDMNGENAEFVKRLSPYASSMNICTLKKEKYTEICNEIIESTGMCPVFVDEFHDADIKINLDNFTMTILQNSNNINISSGYEFSVLPIYENLLPQGVCKYDFYSALYELCGVFSLGESVFDTIMVNNEKKNVHDVHFS